MTPISFRRFRPRGAARALVLALALTAAPAPASAPVTLNFANSEIETVVRAIGLITGKNFLVDPRVKGTLNIQSVRPVSPTLAYQILVSSLRMQGYAVVEGPGVVKVLPEADAKTHFSRTFGKTVGSAGDQVVTQVYPLQHANAAQLVSVLRPLIAPNNAVAAYPGSNTLVITDYADNLKRISQILDALDKPNEAEFSVIKVEHLSAIELANQLTRLFAETTTAAGGASATPTFLIGADARSNSLLVRADHPGKLDSLRALVAKLDQPAAGLGTMRVVPLRNAEAAKLAETLRNLAAGESRAAASATSAGTAGTTNGAAAAVSGAGANVTIQADVATNSLIINAPDHLYNNLRAVIDALDTQRAQIFVEALIVEVTDDRAKELGIQWQAPLVEKAGDFALFGGTNFGTGANNLLGLSTAIAAGEVTALPGAGINLALGQRFTVDGKEVVGLTALARALQSEAGANVLSTPNLLTLDNEEAKIVIGRNVPFITGSYAQSATTGSAATVNPFQTIERKDVGLTLKVKPQVSEGGRIKLTIQQEVSSVQDTTNQAGIITNKRSIDTAVQVGDGETIVLGGLIQDDVRASEDKVPLLGDIPLLGALFRSEKTARTKTNLMVFLRPRIVGASENMASLTRDRYDYIRNAFGAEAARILAEEQAAERTAGRPPQPGLRMEFTLPAAPADTLRKAH